MSRITARVRSLWHGLRRRSAVEADMSEEFRLHVELRAQDLMRSGLSPAEAVRQARREFGGTERYKDEARASRGCFSSTGSGSRGWTSSWDFGCWRGIRG